jgi:hypothetical protein
MDDFQWILFGLVLALTRQPRLVIRRIPLRKTRTINDKTPAIASGQTQGAV